MLYWLEVNFPNPEAPRNPRAYPTCPNTRKPTTAQKKAGYIEQKMALTRPEFKYLHFPEEISTFKIFHSGEKF